MTFAFLMKPGIKDETIAYARLDCQPMCGSSLVRRSCGGGRLNIGLTQRFWIDAFWVVWMEKVYQGESTLVSKLNYHNSWT